MEVTFKKNLSKSYMCVEEQGKPIEEYELYILEKHKIPGLLQMHTVFSEGKRRYLYDISGKQQIEDYFSGRKMGYDVLQRFLLSIQDMCVRLSEYLLREDGICLEMEFIYVSLEDGSLQFTYLPCDEKNLQEAFELCMEQFLRKIDHQDSAAVELGYRIYQLCNGGNANIGRLLEEALGRSRTWEMGEMQRAVEDSAWVKENQERESRKEEDGENGKDKTFLKSKEEETSGKVKETWIKELEKRKYQMTEIIGKYLPFFHRMLLTVLEKMGEKHIKREVKKVKGAKKEKHRAGRMEKEYKQAEDAEGVQALLGGTCLNDADFPVHPTEILEVQKKHPVGKLVYQGIHQCEDILLEGDSFLLGKNSAQVDGVILADGVSRLHARMSRQEDRYFIEDLNSMNGTYLNDTALEYHQPREVKENDRIRFGAEEYLFL